jgi:hypothetical protein
MKKLFFSHVGLSVVMIFLLSFITQSSWAQNDRIPALASAKASILYIKKEMDQYHNRFVVYEDVSSAGNHFHVYAKIPDGTAPVEMNGSFVVPSSGQHQTGATVIRCEFKKDTSHLFGGFYFQNGILPAGQFSPLPNFGETPNAGINLSGARYLTFWAKGDKGGERIDFFMGGVGRDAQSGNPTQPYPDSSPRNPALGVFGSNSIILSASWEKYFINVNFLNLNYVLGGFAWVAKLSENPNGAVFCLDDIQYELNDTAITKRLNLPRFARSFTTLPVQPDPNDSNPGDDLDLVLRNTAFTYDNALALLAFLADSTAENLQMAKLIGDAFVYAAQHDRSFTDGRIRDAYAAGDIALPPGWVPNGRTATVPVPGFYDEMNQHFVEVESSGVSVGNNAWVMIALLALYKRTPDPAYLDAAKKIGQFIQGFRNNTGRYQGFQGGLDNVETSTPVRRVWASTEHNLDIFAGFTVMNQVTGEIQWQDGAQHAKAFIDSMWNSQINCYHTGTIDPGNLNMMPGQLPIDPQSWSTIASPVFHQPVNCPEQNHRISHHGFAGFDFNEDKDGVWFEGTAQMGVAYAFANLPQKAFDIRAELRRVQQTLPFGDSLGIVAACHDGVSSGFGFNYFRRLHVGATSWNVFAQLQFNPYYQTYTNLVTSAPLPDTILGQFALKNYPNPFMRNTTIVFCVPQQQHVKITIYNLAGQQIATLIDEMKLPGNFAIEWKGLNQHGNPVSRGFYLVHMVAGGSTINRKILFLK